MAYIPGAGGRKRPLNAFENPIQPTIKKALPRFQSSGKHWTVDTDNIRAIESKPQFYEDAILAQPRNANQTMYGHRSARYTVNSEFRPDRSFFYLDEHALNKVPTKFQTIHPKLNPGNTDNGYRADNHTVGAIDVGRAITDKQKTVELGPTMFMPLEFFDGSAEHALGQVDIGKSLTDGVKSAVIRPTHYQPLSMFSESGSLGSVDVDKAIEETKLKTAASVPTFYMPMETFSQANANALSQNVNKAIEETKLKSAATAPTYYMPMETFSQANANVMGPMVDKSIEGTKHKTAVVEPTYFLPMGTPFTKDAGNALQMEKYFDDDKLKTVNADVTYFFPNVSGPLDNSRLPTFQTNLPQVSVTAGNIYHPLTTQARPEITLEYNRDPISVFAGYDKMYSMDGYDARRDEYELMDNRPAVSVVAQGGVLPMYTKPEDSAPIDLADHLQDRATTQYTNPQSVKYQTDNYKSLKPNFRTKIQPGVGSIDQSMRQTFNDNRGAANGGRYVKLKNTGVGKGMRM